MYKKTNPQQYLFGVETQLSASLRARLKDSWSQHFRDEILPILFKSEDKFSSLYGTTGRPNFSVARMLGLCLLQELNNLNDQQALDAFSFDLRWHHALDVSGQDVYLSRRSLVEFRRRLAHKDPEMAIVRTIFEDISTAAIEKLGISPSEQRLDSTHVVSNIRTRGKFDLFQKTTKLFLNSLAGHDFARIPEPIADWHHHQTEGWFSMVPKKERAAKLEQLAEYVFTLINLFKKEKHITTSEPYQLLVRLFNEQCSCFEKSAEDDDDCEYNRVELKNNTHGETLQSPYDPDVSYGHKGKGYSVHITETCNNEETSEIITDYEVHGAARPDIGKAIGVIERLEMAGLKPEVLFADGGYTSVPSTFEITQSNVEFIAPVNRNRLSNIKMGRDQFVFDDDGLVLKCPVGNKPIDHRMRSANNKKGSSSLHAIFHGDTCRACSKLAVCPVRAPNNRKSGCGLRKTKGNFRLEITPQLILRDRMYVEQQSLQWKERYKIRSGVEATMSELKRSHGMGKLRVRRAAKVIFAVACKVIACNIKRWAKAHPAYSVCFGSYNLLQCIYKSIFELTRVFQGNRNIKFAVLAGRYSPNIDMFC